jgi:hypothetical protein
MEWVSLRLKNNGCISDTVKLKPNTSYKLDFPIDETFPLRIRGWRAKTEALLQVNGNSQQIELPCRHYYTKPKDNNSLDSYQYERVAVKIDAELVNQILANPTKARLRIEGRDQGLQRTISFSKDI